MGGLPNGTMGDLPNGTMAGSRQDMAVALPVTINAGTCCAVVGQAARAVMKRAAFAL